MRMCTTMLDVEIHDEVIAVRKYDEGLAVRVCDKV